MLIDRKAYMDRLTGFRDKQVIKVVTGVRRCGKSTLLEMFRQRLLDEGVAPDRIVSINFEDFDAAPLTDPAALHAHIISRMVPGEMLYVFLDEVHHVVDFPRVVDSLYIKPGIDLYITGSNGYMLSGEIATLISGRYVQIDMLPLSFAEYCEGVRGADGLARMYAGYLETGAFPFALQLAGQPRQIRDYLEGILNTIIVKDVMQRSRITDVLMFKSVLRFVFDNIGSPLSPKKIADTMTSEGRKMDVRTVEKYLNALMESYVIYEAKRYNIKGRQYLKSFEKYYAVDLGLRHTLLGSRATDVDHMLENVVYLELLRRGCEVCVGRIDEYEVDFVAIDADETRYYQVAATVRDPDTLERELRPLRKIADHYPKRLLTLDEDPEADYDGIRRINALDWLLGRCE